MPDPTPAGEPALDTLLIHAGTPEPRIAGAVSTPVFQSSTFEFGGEEDYHDVRYIRLNNTPNHHELATKLAALEEAEAALVAASGMAAISTALGAVLKPGDHLLAQNCLYGGTHDLVAQDYPEQGIAVDFVAGDDPDEWESKLRPETKAFYLESASNPLLEVPKLEAAAAFARAHGLVSIIDNTFPSPFNFRPTTFGFDLVVESATKYLNGHSDIVAGVVAGRAELVERVRRRLNLLGGSLDPHACFLLSRGVKTLAVRLRHQNVSGLAVARFLRGHPAVEAVHYPGLEGDPGHERAARWFRGFGGMLSFLPSGGFEAARRIIDRTRYFIDAPSLGGVESLATLPSQTSHKGMSREDRLAVGIEDGLVRLSIGIEDANDLIADLAQALG